MYYISNTVNFLTCNSILPPLEKDTSTQFACITLKVDSTEDFHCFDDCLFSSEVPYITKSFYTKEHMDIHSPVFNDINLLQKDLLPIIFFYQRKSAHISVQNEFCRTHYSSSRSNNFWRHGAWCTNYWHCDSTMYITLRYTSITIHYNYYHVPKGCDYLLIPKLLFNPHGGDTGTFNIGDKCATLSLNGKSPLQIMYNSKSYLPVALACNATDSDSPTEVNL